MKRLIIFLIAAALLLAGSGSVVFADGAGGPAMSQKKIMVYIRPDVTVKLDGIKQCFRNSLGQDVYPMIFNGCTYLPVRASSALMKEPIEWDQASKTVFIGKTLSNPNKATGTVSTAAAVAVSETAITSVPKPTLESAFLRPDILVMYDFVIQTFQDVNGNTVYPIIYNGTTYLPVRAISKLMGAPIEWDGKTKTITIEKMADDAYAVIEGEPGGEEDEDAAAIADTAAIKMKSLFEREEVLYYEATGHATAINATASIEDKELIAAAITDNYLKAQKLTLEIKNVDQTSFKEAEKAALQKLSDYAESTEYYILVLENIAYMAAQGSDYSGLAETFLYFAMDSQMKMEEARSAIQELN